MPRKPVLWLILPVAGLILAGLLFGSSRRPAAAYAPEVRPLSLPDVDISVDTVVANGFDRPVQVTHAGDGSGRLFVVEQSGRIKIIKNGTVLASSFLDITALVSCCGERGLLGLAFHPDYANNGYFYVNYTNNNGDTVVARYHASANSDVADAASAFVLLTIDQPYTNHNGGQLLFGPTDGYLYISTGDGGSGGDPGNRAQDIDSLLGKMLRLDVNSGSPYAIPPDNPFVNQPGRDEIWSLGLRNPWRVSFDRATGDMYLGDVGQNAWEEISFQAANTPGGVNFGWRCLEGTHDYNFSGDCASLTLTDPIAEYGHSEGRAVTGGFVYRGSDFVALRGRYFYADSTNGKIWSIYQTGPTSWSAPALELDTPYSITGFGEDETGELYTVDFGGAVRRLTDVAGLSPDYQTSTKNASTPHLDNGEILTYTLSLRNSGGARPQTIFLRDALPAGLNYVGGSLVASLGVVDDSAAPLLRWQGPAVTTPVTITYRAQVDTTTAGNLINRATLTGTAMQPVTLTQAIFTPRPALTSTLADFTLPGSQPNSLIDDLGAAADCSLCHTEPIYDRWRGSMMGQAGRDPLFWAALAVANNDAPNAGEFCLRCHTPKGWLQGRSHPPNGAALLDNDMADGIACTVCHRMVDPQPSAGAIAAIDADIRADLSSQGNLPPADHVGSAMLIVDPQDRRRGPFVVNAPHSAYQTDFLGQTANPVTESRLCGSCHNIDNPLLSWDSVRGQYWPNQMDAAPPSVSSGDLFPIERTYDEWLYSDFAAGGVYLPQFAGEKADGIVESCQDCHLPRTTGLGANFTGAVERDCRTSGCLPEHTLVGGNTWVPQLLQDARWRLSVPPEEAALLDQTVQAARSMLRRSATLSLTLTTVQSGTQAVVRVINNSGHKLPTGYPEGRRMWLNVRAFDAAGALIYESGAYDDTTADLTLDTDVTVYEVKQGMTPELATLVEKEAGPSFHFVLNNTVVKDTRIPPRGYDPAEAAWQQAGMRPVGATFAAGQYWDDATYLLPPETERVVARLHYQTASREYIEFLAANGGVDGATLRQLWEDSKSPPELVAAISMPEVLYYFPIIFK